MRTDLYGGAIAGLCFVGSGVALVIARRALVTGVLFIAAGAAMLVGAVLFRHGGDSGAFVLVLGWGVFLPPALVTYPMVRWRHPVDFVTLVTLAGSALVALVGHDLASTQVTSLVVGCALFAHTWWHFEVADPDERRALAWPALSVAVAGLVTFFGFFATTDPVVLSVCLAFWGLVGPAAYIGVNRPELVDVRGLVVRVVVLAVAFITYLAVFMLLVGLVGEAAGHPDLSIGVTALLGAVAAITFHPTQVMLRGVVDQLLFGERPDPLDAAGLVAGRIGDDPVDALRAIREALVLPYAALRDGDGEVAVSGTLVTHTREIPLGEGTVLVVGLRAGDLGLSRGDEGVLRLVAPLLAQTLRARALTTELLESRGQRITAVEEERRRLRRDLHDGLGPRLSGVAFTADAVRNLMTTDPDAARDLLKTMREETAIAIADIRRLVYAMRPPALDELGLVPALRQQAVGLRNRDGQVVAVSVSAPEELPALSAAVEVAAYRIVTEALTNVARHSAGCTATVDLRPAPEGLAIEVVDGGAPAAPDAWRAGVGLSSMRERAAELGGTLLAGPGPDGGRVSALLPLAV